jgi:hypothetical protein
MDYETLELMRPLRLRVGGNELRENPRAVASQAVWTAIERWAEVVTGDPQFFGTSGMELNDKASAKHEPDG